MGDAAEILAGVDPRVGTVGRRAWTAAARLALELISGGRFLPVATPGDHAGSVRVRWRPLLRLPEDRRRRRRIARALPAAAWLAAPGTPGAPADALDAFLAQAVDSLVRRASTTSPVRSGWEADFVEHLGGTGAGELFLDTPALAAEILAWLPPPVPEEGWRASFALDPPVVPGRRWRLHLSLGSDDEPGLVADGADVLAGGTPSQRAALESALGRLGDRLPDAAVGSPDSGGDIWLDVADAAAFLTSAASTLAADGFDVSVPAGLDARGPGRLRLELLLGDGDPAWQATLGGDVLADAELAELERHGHTLVCREGEWLVIDPAALAEARRVLAGRPPVLAPAEVVAAALAGAFSDPDLADVHLDEIGVVASGEVARLARALQQPAPPPAPAPAGFHGELRGYQAVGLSWLRRLDTEGFGGCLADDMGLGKTVQTIALLLSDPGPTLVVCPLSVLGTWEREVRRFAPGLRPFHQYGPDRPQTVDDLGRVLDGATVCITTYGLLRRDAALLAAQPWHRVVFDEAQNVKNPRAATTRAAADVAAAASHRLALTGTPVENHLGELWSIFELTNRGLLGPLESFRRRFAGPIERSGDQEAAGRLRKIAAPFLLRRRKSDPDILPDLPPKHETTLLCALTAEQAALYRKTTETALRAVSAAAGIERRGRVLALLTRLKQICNHPAQFLGQEDWTPDRSGKLSRLLELVAEVREEGDRSLVFTQYRQMGSLLAKALGDAPFFHGGLSHGRREALVAAFQEDPDSPDVMVVSLRAGGTGLTLTAANRVFHFDRWWNPAVEDQATDRAHRIGQTRDVWVHKLVCMGTLEERIAAMLERKRGLAETVVGAGEEWLSELSDSELAALVRLEEGAVLP